MTRQSSMCIAFANHKGGTGKTTTCLSIAGFLAKVGMKVLVVDLDPQANATSGLGIDATSLQHSMYDVVLGQCSGYEGVPIAQVVLETDLDNLHLAPAEWDLAVAEVLLQPSEGKSSALNHILDSVRTLYDYILIDLPPSLQLLTVNGLCAADQVVLPLDPSVFSLESLRNLKTTFADIGRMTGRSLPHITVLLIRHAKSNLLSRMVRGPNPSQQVEARLREMFDTVFIVPQAREIYEAQQQGLPISHYAPRSRVGKAYEGIALNIQTRQGMKDEG